MKTIVAIAVICVGSAFFIRAADPKTNWANNCAQCHGADGRADTKMGKQLSAKDLTDPKVQAAFTDAKATGRRACLRSPAERLIQDRVLLQTLDVGYEGF